MSLGREEVQLLVPQLSKLKILSLVLGEVDADTCSVDMSSIRADDVEDIQQEYHRKCLLLKIDVLGMITARVDYAPVFQQIQNLDALNYLSEAMGECVLLAVMR